MDGKFNRATSLLDLFHAGQPSSSDPSSKTSDLIRIDGHVNVNTASRDALRMLAAGTFVMDPSLSLRLSDSHTAIPVAAPHTKKLQLDAPMSDSLADTIADAIIANRPFTSPSPMAAATDANGNEVFGNRNQYPQSQNIQWTDAAAEEVFARVYQSTTTRSRNFRVWVIGQAISPTTAMNAGTEVLSEVRKVHTIFIDPGTRTAEGAIIDGNLNIQILSNNEF